MHPIVVAMLHATAGLFYNRKLSHIQGGAHNEIDDLYRLIFQYL